MVELKRGNRHFTVCPDRDEVLGCAWLLRERLTTFVTLHKKKIGNDGLDFFEFNQSTDGAPTTTMAEAVDAAVDDLSPVWIVTSQERTPLAVLDVLMSDSLAASSVASAVAAVGTGDGDFLFSATSSTSSALTDSTRLSNSSSSSSSSSDSTGISIRGFLLFLLLLPPFLAGGMGSTTQSAPFTLLPSDEGDDSNRLLKIGDETCDGINRRCCCCWWWWSCCWSCCCCNNSAA